MGGERGGGERENGGGRDVSCGRASPPFIAPPVFHFDFPSLGVRVHRDPRVADGHWLPLSAAQLRLLWPELFQGWVEGLREGIAPPV